MDLDQFYDPKLVGNWDVETMHNIYESSIYTMTDSDFNDLSSLFCFPINQFFVDEEYSHYILNLKKKIPKQKNLFTSQISSYQSEVLQKENFDPEENENNIIQSKGKYNLRLTLIIS